MDSTFSEMLKTEIRHDPYHVINGYNGKYSDPIYPDLSIKKTSGNVKKLTEGLLRFYGDIARYEEQYLRKGILHEMIVLFQRLTNPNIKKRMTSLLSEEEYSVSHLAYRKSMSSALRIVDALIRYQRKYEKSMGDTQNDISETLGWYIEGSSDFVGTQHEFFPYKNVSKHEMTELIKRLTVPKQMEKFEAFLDATDVSDTDRKKQEIIKIACATITHTLLMGDYPKEHYIEIVLIYLDGLEELSQEEKIQILHFTVLSQ